jgi:hypothetical protein
VCVPTLNNATASLVSEKSSRLSPYVRVSRLETGGFRRTRIVVQEMALPGGKRGSVPAGGPANGMGRDFGKFPGR